MNIYWKIALWIAFLYVFSLVKLADVYCIVTGIVAIFLNLGERKGASAYSVFNEGCKKLAGDFDPNSVIKKNFNKEKVDYIPPDMIVKNHRLANKPCPCGSGLKHKKCCLHKKIDNL